MTNEELAARIQQGQRGYIPELYGQVKKLLRCKARGYFNKFYGACSRCGVELDDLIQEGYFAMLDAVKAFKPDTGHDFSTYLSFPILNRFKALTNCGRGKKNPLNQAASLETPLSNDEALTLGDTIPDENSGAGFDKIDTDLYQTALHFTLEKGIEQLTPEQRSTIRCRYYENKTLDQTGAAIGCNRERVRQYQAKALRVLRKPQIAKTLRPFLEDEICSYSLRGSGLQSFKNTGVSSVERTAEHMEGLKKQVVDSYQQVQEYLAQASTKKLI